MRADKGTPTWTRDERVKVQSINRIVESIKDTLFTIHLTPLQAYDLIKSIVNRTRIEPKESVSEIREEVPSE